MEIAVIPKQTPSQSDDSGTSVVKNLDTPDRDSRSQDATVDERSIETAQENKSVGGEGYWTF